MNNIIINQVSVIGMFTTIIASGYPKDDNPKFDISRLHRLSRAEIGSGHDCCLKGITVYSTITADHSFWLQWQRYHFHDIISSTSKMHSLVSMKLNFHPKTSAIAISNAIENVTEFKNGKIDFETLVMSMPIGLMLKASTISNYLQLKTIYFQRKNHKMESWKEYCKWILGLPEMEIILRKESNS